MKTFIISRDFEKPSHAGASELYQLISVTDEDENDLSNKVDSGRFFRDEEQLKIYLRKTYKIDESEDINIEYDDAEM